MKAKLNVYIGDRIYVPTNHAGIKKILVWDKEANQYLAPERGKKYQARKQVNGKTITVQLESLKECQIFRTETVASIETDGGQPIRDVIAEYKASPTWAGHSRSTQIMYDGLFLRWFDLINEIPIRHLDSAKVSAWIQAMKDEVNRFGNAGQRKSFKKEFDLLKSVLTWYQGHKEDPKFSSPIRARHSDEYWLEHSHTTREDDFEAQVSDEIPLTEEQYLRFRAELGKAKFGDLMVILADVQYDYALRVCEVAALMWSDIRWGTGHIKFQRHIEYIHRGRTQYPDRIVPGLKNKRSVKNGNNRFKNRESLSKTHPFFPRSSSGLKKLYLSATEKEGLVFVNPETGSFFSYKCIKDKYDRAFKRAKFDYTGTHIVRYGGVNNFMKAYGADEEAAMELLGNKSEGRYILRKANLVGSVVANRSTEKEKP